MAEESQGFTFEISDSDSPASYTEVGQITNFSLFDGQANEIDTTHLGSTAKERIIGLQDWGTISLDLNYANDDAGQDAMRAAKASRGRKYFKVTLSSGVIFNFFGYVQGTPISGAVDAKMDTSYNILIDGDVTES